MGRHKRHRGGQPGNQNARKHGFYSLYMTRPEIRELLKILDREDIDRGISMLRIKLKSVLRLDPANRRVLREAVRLLYKWYIIENQFIGAEKTEFKKSVRLIFENVADDLQNQSRLNRKNSLKKTRNES